MFRKCRAIARVVKTHGKLGEVVAVTACGLPHVMAQGQKICIVPPALKGPRWREIEDISGDETGALLAISGIENISDAESIVGKTILVAEEDLPENMYLADVDELLGEVVCDKQLGELGYIAEIMQGVAQDVWVLKREGDDILLPIIEDIVLGRDDDGCIVLDVREGMSDIVDAMRGN